MTTSHTLLASLGLYFFPIQCNLFFKHTYILKPQFYTNQTQHTLMVFLLVRHNRKSKHYLSNRMKQSPTKTIIHFVRNNKTKRHQRQKNVLISKYTGSLSTAVEWERTLLYTTCPRFIEDEVWFFHTRCFTFIERMEFIVNHKIYLFDFTKLWREQATNQSRTRILIITKTSELQSECGNTSAIITNNMTVWM